MSTLSDIDPAFLAIESGLRFARKSLSADVTAQRLLILLSVYRNQGQSQRQLLATLEATSITALSRNLADLSALTSKKQPGPALLELKTDPQNLRIKRVYLTSKGKKFIRQWKKALTAGQASRISGG